MTTTDVVKAEAAELVPRETESTASLPACLEWITADGHKPTVIVGMLSDGNWVPPVALSEDQASEFEGALAKFAQLLEPAQSDAARELLSRLAINCRLEEMPEKMWRMHLDDFVADLVDVPEDLIAEACRLWRRWKKFWPTISEFLALIEPELGRRRRTLRRLQVLARVVSDPAPDGIATGEWVERVDGGHTRAISRVGGMCTLGQALDRGVQSGVERG